MQTERFKIQHHPQNIRKREWILKYNLNKYVFTIVTLTGFALQLLLQNNPCQTRKVVY